MHCSNSTHMVNIFLVKKNKDLTNTSVEYNYEIRLHGIAETVLVFKCLTYA